MSTTSHKASTGVTKPVRQYDSQSPVNSDVILPGPCTLLRVTGSLSALGPNDLWVMFFDSATVPEDGAVPLFAPIPATLNPTGSFDVDFNTRPGHGLVCGIDVVNGLCWAASTTFATLTQDTSGVTWVTVRFR